MLETIDFKILSLLKKHGDLNLNNIAKLLNSDIDTTRYRCEQLSQPQNFFEFNNGATFPISGSGYICLNHQNKYEITIYGNKILEDHNATKKKEFFCLLLKSVIAPIIVAFITTLITLTLKGL